MESIVLYVAPACSECEEAEAFFAGRGLPFRTAVFSDEAVRRQVLAHLPQAEPPVVQIGGRWFAGFRNNRAAIERIVAERGLIPSH